MRVCHVSLFGKLHFFCRYLRSTNFYQFYISNTVLISVPNLDSQVNMDISTSATDSAISNYAIDIAISTYATDTAIPISASVTSATYRERFIYTLGDLTYCFE